MSEQQPTFQELFMAAINRPDPRPMLFKVGQKVRIKKKVLHDGQTPTYWAGAVVTVIGSRATMLHKEHVYELKHDNGVTDYFTEEELDLRYSHKV